jgi:hypothetical protein
MRIKLTKASDNRFEKLMDIDSLEELVGIYEEHGPFIFFGWEDDDKAYDVTIYDSYIE